MIVLSAKNVCHRLVLYCFQPRLYWYDEMLTEQTSVAGDGVYL